MMLKQKQSSEEYRISYNYIVGDKMSQDIISDEEKIRIAAIDDVKVNNNLQKNIEYHKEYMKILE